MPVIANGRIHKPVPVPGRLCGFNPRPLLLTGESAGSSASWSATSGFNPRPLLLTGESVLDRRELLDYLVSIHARYC